jgi:aldehyde dehydrogenase (NAD+)
MVDEGSLYIDGKFVEASDGARFHVINPANEDVIGSMADATAADVDSAVGAARRAFDETTWSLDRAFRRHCLAQLQEALRIHTSSFREIQTAEAGICTSALATQVDGSINDMTFDIEMIDAFEWETEFPVYERGGFRSRRRVRYEPYGVVGAITPWNSPFALNLWTSIPGLATGNTVVLKTAPDTPIAGSMLAHVIDEYTDIPSGVINIISASNNAIGGDALTGDSRVDMFHFTGSVTVGQRIAERAAVGLRKVVLELGGKSANIVLDDADLDVAIPFSARSCMSHAGQGCLKPTRMIAHASVYDEVVDRLIETVGVMVVGDPRDPATTLGPIIRQAQVDRIAGFVQRAQLDGGKVVVGGKSPNVGNKGYWYEPTVIVDVDQNSEIAQNEVFGPVLVVIKYDGDDDVAVRIANNSRYGLSGYVQSRDVDRACRIANRMRTGAVNIGLSTSMAVDTPFGGWGMSGLGREHGVEGWREFLQSKTIASPA